MFLCIIAVIVFLFCLVFTLFLDDASAASRTFIRGAGAVMAAVLILMSCATYIPTGYTGIVTTFGKVHDSTLDAGISFKAPWDDVIRMDNREQRVKFELEAFSKDIQEVQIVGSVNLNIDKATAMNLYREVGTDYLNVLVAPRVQEDVKAITSKFTAEELISNRNSLSDSMCELLRGDLKVNGINVISISIENIDFTDAFTNAVEAKQVATQEKQRARTQQEQQTMEAQQEAERKKIAAEAAAEVKRIQADADAYEIKTKADAEAEANEKIAATVTEELINYTQAQNWDGRLPGTYIGSGSAIPLIQTDAEKAGKADKADKAADTEAQ